MRVQLLVKPDVNMTIFQEKTKQKRFNKFIQK